VYALDGRKKFKVGDYITDKNESKLVTVILGYTKNGYKYKVLNGSSKGLKSVIDRIDCNKRCKKIRVKEAMVEVL
jgi:hypothetical protein